MIKIILILTISLVFICACGVNKNEHETLKKKYDTLLQENNKLKSEIKQLKDDLDEYINGVERNLAIIKKAIDKNDFFEANNKLLLLQKYHPEEMQKERTKKLITLLENKEKAILLKKRKEEEEAFRLENLKNTGIWIVTHYSDSFGEKTDINVIMNQEKIKGKFSNTATTNSELDVTFLIDSSSEIDIMLYEYAGRTPIKTTYRKHYSVQMQDKDGKRTTLSAANYSDRLSFTEESSKLIHNTFLNGGIVKFVVSESGGASTYRFDLIVTWYENAYKLLTGT